MNKKTKFTRVAVSGPTIDGREITAQQINEMAANYNVGTYQANIWMEHLRGVYPDSTFGNYGHVLALKAEDYEINGTNQRALYAEMEVTPELVAWNEKNQKKGFSIEITPNFAKTNTAYLSGLAVTDSPASLGTEALKFNIQVRKEPEHLFTTALEFSELDFIEESNEPTDQKGFFKNMFTGLFAAQQEQKETQPIIESKTVDGAFNIADLQNVLNQFAEKQDEVIASFKAELQTQKDAFNALQTEFNTLKATPKTDVKADFVDGSGNKINETDC